MLSYCPDFADHVATCHYRSFFGVKCFAKQDEKYACGSE